MYDAFLEAGQREQRDPAPAGVVGATAARDEEAEEPRPADPIEQFRVWGPQYMDA